jgi:hypothetical protein
MPPVAITWSRHNSIQFSTHQLTASHAIVLVAQIRRP